MIEKLIGKKIVSAICFITLVFCLAQGARAQGNQIVTNGGNTTAVPFVGAGCYFSWTNDKPGIGLPASGNTTVPAFSAINNGTTPITATITVTTRAIGYSYIPNTGSGTVSKVNNITGKVVKTVPVGTTPFGVAVNAAGSRIYVTNNGSGTISVLDSTNTVINTYNEGPFPEGIAISPDGNTLYVANYNLNILKVINANTGAIITSIPVGTKPYAVAISPDGKKVYVSNQGNGTTPSTVSVINAVSNTFSTNINVGIYPVAAAVSPDGATLYVANQVSNTISVINIATNAIITTIPGVNTPVGVAVSIDGSKLYVSVAGANSVSVYDTSTYGIITSIPVGLIPYGISVNPDGSQIFVANVNSNSVSIINTASNTVSTTTSVGNAPYAVGTSFTLGSGCHTSIAPFTITVNPSPTIVASAATGTISACSGTASVSPNVQQFTVSGSYLTSGIVVTAPAGFEISLSPGAGFTNTKTLPPTAGVVSNTIIYVRSASTAPAGSITGNVGLTSTGATTVNVAVSGTINPLPTVNAVANQTVANNASTTAIIFTGTANTYNWTNNTPAIGLAASGSGNIPSFTATNPGPGALTATITVTPNASTGCTGTPITFKIIVNAPVPTIISSAVTGTISACQGSASVNPNIQQFTVAGTTLSSAINASAPASFEISLSPSAGFGNSVSVNQSGGTVPSTIIYVRSASSAPAGNITGNVNLTSTGAATKNVAVSGTINPLPTVNAVANQTVANNMSTTAVNFTGTADTYSWTNDTPAIGLAASGSGNIASFAATNTGTALLTATITVTPNAITGCTGTPINFKITVLPPMPVINVSAVMGTILACAGTVSISPNIQQFTVSGLHLPGAINVSAPAGFEISLSPTGGFGNNIALNPAGGTVGNTIIYARSAASAPAGNISGNVTLSSAGATSQNASVSGNINPLPTVNTVANKTVVNGGATTNINFTGTADTYNWVNDTPSIGLASNGTGDIASFTSINTTLNTIIATITVTPVNANGCTGTTTTFTIKVIPSPVITATGTLAALTTIYGTASSTTSFDVSGTNMTAGILVSPPLGFEVSSSATSGFGKTVTVGSVGTIASTTVYIRLAAKTGVGTYSGNVTLTSAGAAAVLVPTVESTVTPAPLTITPANESHTYGMSITGGSGSTYFTSSGLQNSEMIGSLTVTFGAGALATDNAGNYPLSIQATNATGGTFNPGNYAINYVNGDMIVYPALLTITADDKSRGYKTDNPTLTATYTGFLNGDTPASLITLPLLTTTATINSIPGPYPITVSGALSGNYTFKYVTGTLTVNRVPVVPNAFTPNGDGINDTWNIKYLDSYPNSSVDIFTRTGINIYNSIGYGAPWDGTYKGAYLPTGTYYYIINLKNGVGLLSGYVVLIR
jgi:gliding motility-associated-like protein